MEAPFRGRASHRVRPVPKPVALQIAHQRAANNTRRMQVFGGDAFNRARDQVQIFLNEKIQRPAERQLTKTIAPRSFLLVCTNFQRVKDVVDRWVSLAAVYSGRVSKRGLPHGNMNRNTPANAAANIA
jgi:hypothetical protein